MATSLQEVYDYFLSKVTDYSFIKLNEEGSLEPILYKNLRSSIVRFTNSSVDLTIDEENQSFVSDLSIFEKEILATIMVMNYVSGKVLHVRNMEREMSDKEYNRFSQANHLDKLIALKKELQSDVSHLLSNYELEDALKELL